MAFSVLENSPQSPGDSVDEARSNRENSGTIAGGRPISHVGNNTNGGFHWHSTVAEWSNELPHACPNVTLWKPVLP